MGVCLGSLTGGRESHTTTTFNRTTTHHSGWVSSDERRKTKVGISGDRRRSRQLQGDNSSSSSIGHDQDWEQIWKSRSGTTTTSASGGYSSPPSTIVTHSGQILETANLKVFTFAELKAATKGFKSELGEGGFGKVYKGWLHHSTLSPAKTPNSASAMLVAIKKLNPQSAQGFQEWKSEINFLGKISHPNLVKLLGYCWENEELLLVYEFMPKGSLENHLFRRNSNIEPLSWNTRLKIAIGAARGLAVLHTSEMQVIYRDFKASNILLDGDYNAKISDFGLAKLGPVGEDSHVTTRIMGTYGYAAPEYMATGHLYVKSDVYGFGVVLLEMMTGLRALDPKRPPGQQNLVLWAKPSLSQKRSLKSIMDSKMEGQYSLKAAFQAGQLALKCLQPDPKKRPSMNDVLKALQDIQAIKFKHNKSRESNKQPRNS